MNIQDNLLAIKNRFLKNYETLLSIVEKNKETEHGKVINKLLEINSPNLLSDLFYDFHDKEDLNSILSLFILLNHAFTDDGGICIEQTIEKSEFEDFEDREIYKISLHENQNGQNLSYHDLDLLITQHKEVYDWLLKNDAEYEIAWNRMAEGDNEFIISYLNMSSKIQSLMKELYLKNKY